MMIHDVKDALVTTNGRAVWSTFWTSWAKWRFIGILFFKSWWWLLLGRAPNCVDVLLGDASLWLIPPWKQLYEKPFLSKNLASRFVQDKTWPVKQQFSISNLLYIFISQFGQTFETNLFLFQKKRFSNVSFWTRDKKRIPFFLKTLCLFAWTHGVPQIAWQVPQSLNAPLWEGEGWLTPVSWEKLMKIHNFFVCFKFQK